MHVQICKWRIGILVNSSIPEIQPSLALNSISMCMYIVLFVCAHLFIYCLHTAFFSDVQVTPLPVTPSLKSPPPLRLHLPTLQIRKCLPLMMCTQKTQWVVNYVNLTKYCQCLLCAYAVYMYRASVSKEIWMVIYSLGVGMSACCVLNYSYH